MTETTTVELKNGVELEVQSDPMEAIDAVKLLYKISEVGDPPAVREEMLDAFELLVEDDNTSTENASYCDREVWERIAEYNGDDHLWRLLEAVATPVMEAALDENPPKVPAAMIERWETENKMFLSEGGRRDGKL